MGCRTCLGPGLLGREGRSGGTRPALELRGLCLTSPSCCLLRICTHGPTPDMRALNGQASLRGLYRHRGQRRVPEHGI